MTVHAKYIFINMHEYLAPLSPCNLGLIYCNDACMLLVRSFCLFFLPWKLLQFTNSSQLSGKQHSPTDHGIFRSVPSVNALSSKSGLSTTTVFNGGCFFLLTLFME